MNLAGYSALEHLVDALFLRSDSLMLIVRPDPLSLYCDASKSIDGNLTTVGGAIASVEKWKAFDKKWREELLEPNHLKYFRMSEFAHSTKQFAKGWKKNETRRREFLQHLARIVVEHVASWVGVRVSQSEYDAADRIFQMQETLQPYPLCGVTCIELAQQWQLANKLDYLPMEYVFEEGDEYSGQYGSE